MSSGEGIAGDIDNYMSDRSEKWSESDAAQSFEEWKGNWEESFDEVTMEEPDEVEAPEDEMTAAEALRDLEEEVGE